MFVHTCTACTKRQLIFPSQVSAVTEAREGIVLSFTCWCGQPQSHVQERLADARPAHALAA